ncbi:MAG: polyribonucleotide nucleotidyltransferase [Candidatus Tectomicrobia bacterium]|uniref:Polyribonucleotide nucleotidyltransferase n=1 Tax=Tectimicrobiota bacterium TaxID=2528274 RepID=A0A932CQJ7_UNCTE|nr:polyribonucleotide nucleotidyltransferase [Candidatus Tectomicrobia bacterium]
MKSKSIEIDIRGTRLSLSTGEVARQANGAVLISYGDTVALATVTAAEEPIAEEVDFFPLTVEYREKFYAAGRIPGGFFKREGRPSDREVITARLTDRPLRPLFPKGFRNEVQVMVLVVSSDRQNDPGLLSLIGSSAALTLSEVPFAGPIGAVRVGYIGGELVINPTTSELKESALNLVVAGTHDGVVMVESGANELPEQIMAEAIEYGHSYIRKIVEMQEALREAAGKEKWPVRESLRMPGLEELVRQTSTERLRQRLINPDKLGRQKSLRELRKEVAAEVQSQMPEASAHQISSIFEEIEKEEVRALIIERGTRVDGRGLKEIRTIIPKVSFLPRTHGSALFTRGETQALVVVTLGTSEDEQLIDEMDGKYDKTFLLHYNFPPFSVGEVKPLRGPGRREVGHGFLAERALTPVIPSYEEFPYTIRVVSEILESNGSSSMATVCGASLSLMDAGVPIKAPVAGVAMGLIKEEQEGRLIVLSDILGTEDHLGDMDFKVAGTATGVTALQMDIKTQGITAEVIREALEQAREGRLHVLNVMAQALDQPREQLSVYAPRIVTIKVRTDKIRDVIGPGGKTIKGIIEKTGVSIDVSDDGTVAIASVDSEAVTKAIEIIRGLTEEAEIGKVYRGKVRRIMDFGAFVEILPGTDGLVHISQFVDKQMNTKLREGDELWVKVLDIDAQGKIRLSQREAMRDKGELPPEEKPRREKEMGGKSRRD